MKVIFSRKGFDSAAGGYPSPIIDGRPVSLPIPTQQPSPITFGDLRNHVADLVTGLTHGRHTAATRCHLDPDLIANALARMPGWRGALGQAGAAQSHLRNNDVGIGDLFLFWGLFRPITKQNGKLKYTGYKEHRIFGWLQVGDVLNVDNDPQPALAEYPWLVDHPHLQAGWKIGNTVYVAAHDLHIGDAPSGLPGWGVFKSGYRMTRDPAGSVSLWSVPDWLNPQRGGAGMSYHPPQRWHGNGTVQAAARGQEFVADIDGSDDAVEWLRDLFKEAT